MPCLVLLAVSTEIAGTHRSSGLDCRNCRLYLCSRCTTLDIERCRQLPHHLIPNVIGTQLRSLPWLVNIR